jgi:FKBP-type peptidyl-prolyl cis-trans isomerase
VLVFALFALQAVAPAPPSAILTTRSGLRFQVLQPGTGRRPTRDDAVLVTYQGRLADGGMFDSADQPVGLVVAQTVPGFAEALLMMNAGGRYRFWIPPRLAYGAAGSGGVVPPNATLDFTLTLIRVGRAAPPAEAR